MLSQLASDFLSAWFDELLRQIDRVGLEFELALVQAFSFSEISDLFTRFGPAEALAQWVIRRGDSFANIVGNFRQGLARSFGVAAVKTIASEFVMPEGASTRVVKEDQAIRDTLNFLVETGTNLSQNNLPPSLRLTVRLKSLSSWKSLESAIKKILGFTNKTNILIKLVVALLDVWVTIVNVFFGVVSAVILAEFISRVKNGQMFTTLDQSAPRAWTRLRERSRVQSG